jgi:serine/threonine protein kinase
VIREIEALSRLSHSNVVKFLEATIIDDSVCIVTEYVQGCELFEHVSHRGRLSEDEARPVLAQIVSAMLHLHAKQIVHRDIKLENILISESGAIKLVDFGLARSYSPSDSERASHQPASTQNDCLLSTRCGSEEYTAPEILMGIPYHGPSVDVWSLGVVMYAVLCGTLPFNPDTFRPRFLSESIIAVRYTSADKRGVSPIANSLIQKMLAYKPSDRIPIADIPLHPFFAT